MLKRVTPLHEKISNDNEYPFSIPAIQNLDFIELNSRVTFFVGENGMGKSTLLEAIAHCCGFNTAGGSRDNTYEVDASESSLGGFIRLAWLPKITNGFFFRAETFYHFASYIDQVDENGYKDYGGKFLHKQSHGEAFLSLFTNRFILDEPDLALSPTRQLTFLKVMYDFRQRGSIY